MDGIPRVVKVKTLNEKHLEVIFSNGIVKNYDCGPILDMPEFFLLRDEAFFKSVKVDTGGYGISWNENIDLSEYELWTNGIETAIVRNQSERENVN